MKTLCSPASCFIQPSIVRFWNSGVRGKKQRKGKKKGQTDEEDKDADEEVAAQEGRGKVKKGKRKKKGDATAGEEEPNTDDEIWKQYDSDADLDAPYVPKVPYDSCKSVRPLQVLRCFLKASQGVIDDAS